MFEPVDYDAYAADADDRETVDGEFRALTRPEQVAEARDFAAHAIAPNTLKAYRLDWSDFC